MSWIQKGIKKNSPSSSPPQKTFRTHAWAPISKPASHARFREYQACMTGRKTYDIGHSPQSQCGRGSLWAPLVGKSSNARRWMAGSLVFGVWPYYNGRHGKEEGRIPSIIPQLRAGPTYVVRTHACGVTLPPRLMNLALLRPWQVKWRKRGCRREIFVLIVQSGSGFIHGIVVVPHIHTNRMHINSRAREKKGAHRPIIGLYSSYY